MIICLKNGLIIHNLSLEWLDELCYDIINEQDPSIEGEEVEYSVRYDPKTPNLGLKLITLLNNEDYWGEISLECDNIDELEDYLTSIIEDHYTKWCDREENKPEWLNNFEKRVHTGEFREECECEDFPCCGHKRNF